MGCPSIADEQPILLSVVTQWSWERILIRRSSCSIACTFADPVEGAAEAGREMTRIPRLPWCLTNSREMYGQAPWFSGSSCAQTNSALVGYVDKISRSA